MVCKHKNFKNRSRKNKIVYQLKKQSVNACGSNRVTANKTFLIK